jgi:dihydrofolate synthase/folylpolyglutamate synthase
LICGDAEPPRSVVDMCRHAKADFRQLGRDFGFLRQQSDRQQWQYWGKTGRTLGGLAYPALRGDCQLNNASCAIAALDALHARLPVTAQDIRRGLAEVEVAGRCQVLPGRPQIVLDVAHNPQAALELAHSMGNMGYARNTWAVFGMMVDKDIAGVVEAMRLRVDRWLPCDLPGPRAASAAKLREIIAKVSPGVTALCFDSPAAAGRHAQENAGEDDRILVFGSFLTVAGVMRFLSRGGT